MAGKRDKAAPPAAKPSLMTRVLALLRGAEDEPAPAAIAGAVSASVPGNAAAPPPPLLDTLTIRQWLWGPGFNIPGDSDYVRDLVKPFAANSSMSILEVASGLGGPARIIAETFDTYVTGLERDPELARLGMEMSVAAGKQKHAPIRQFDPESFELRTGAFDCILGRGATYMVQDKERFMRVLILGLKQRGQLLLTDYIIDPTRADRPEVAMWAALQPVKPHLWTLRQYTDCFNSLGFDTRITEDVTADVKAQIILGWERLLHHVNLKSLPRLHRLAVVDECERWVKTIMALDSGAIRGYRFYALAGTSRPPVSSIKKAK
jgi:SAM-dependent methyltransferase